MQQKYSTRQNVKVMKRAFIVVHKMEKECVYLAMTGDATLAAAAKAAALPTRCDRSFWRKRIKRMNMSSTL